MGVHGLWDLLAPAGRRVSVETLAGKRLAIDASIWMVQFMKAMRDEKGEMIHNAHLLGFFRRICKLLFLRARPVFVFDGATPAIKRRTVMSRRKNRENAQAKVRKTAEKLLLNHLKTMRLKELADDIKNQRENQKTDEKGANPGFVSDEMLPPHILAEKDVTIDAVAAAMLSDDEEIIPPDMLRSNLETNDMASSSRSRNQQKLDEMLAASLMEEEKRGLSNNASTSNASFLVEDEDDDEDEQMILPEMDCGVDPSILASLPPSMQLDLLVQIRERLMAENRQKYQQVKKDPEKFSELQIQAYLKTVAFRREIDQVQKTASGRGVDGVQTSRIASEANREFLFSSSFTGDKRELASGRAEKNGDKLKSRSGSEGHPVAIHTAASTSKSKPEAGSKVNGERRDFDEDIETYVDDRGRVRVSRVRAMGIHMTRDLQRNLDLMKEIEQERETVDSLESQNRGQSQRAGLIEKAVHGTSFGGLEPIRIDVDEDSMPKSDATLQISFEHDGDIECLDDEDDNIFTRLAAENPMTLPSDDFTPLVNVSSPSDSECEWEEGNVDETNDEILTDNVPFMKGNTSDDSDVEWEEGVSEIMETAASTVAETRKTITKGYLEEEADLQEAIKRSLEKSLDSISALPGENTHAVSKSHDQEDMTEEQIVLGDFGIERNKSTSGSFCDVGVLGVSKTDDSVSLENLDSKQSAYPVSQLNLEDRTEEPTVLGNDDIKQYASTSETVYDNSKHFEVSCVNITNTSNGADLRTTVEAEPLCPVVKMACSAAPLSEELMNELICDIDKEEKLAAKEGNESGLREIDDVSENSAFKENEGFQANLDEELRVLQEERMDLGDDRRRLERNADSVSSEMYMECQELLQMFGIPFIIAPMEAEAQCAFMEQANLVDGVVTDDSDVFLFGARSVYKNIFDDRKYVETYFMKDIETEIGLSREKLIRMALLLGSDYTEGVSGIGIVNAIEVLTAFPEENGLQEFRDWIESPDPTILGNFGSQTEKVSVADQIQDLRKIFMDKHRKLSKNWHIPSSFPSDTVISAYLSPEVDKSTETFTWGKPDHFVLRKLCWEKFGWANQKADDLIVPVLKEYGKRETQRRLEEFYTFNERFAKIRSKRIKKAVKGITGKQSLERTVDGAPEVSGRKNRKKSKRSESENDQSESVDYTEKLTPKRYTQSRRGRGRGRGRGKASGRRKRKESPSSEASEIRSSDNEDEDINTEKQEIPETLRRSTRSRKQVDYSVKDTDDLDQSADKNDKQLFDEEPPKQDDPSENATWGFGQDSQCRPEDVSPKQASETDYLGQGGGFCPENDDNDPPNPKENFENGGGFCTDEDDKVGGGFCPENDDMNPLNPKAIFENGGGFCTDEDNNSQVRNRPGEVSEPDNENPANSAITHLRLCSSVRETDTHSGPTIPVGSLRSMPHLRRKRRKT